MFCIPEIFHVFIFFDLRVMSVGGDGRDQVAGSVTELQEFATTVLGLAVSALDRMGEDTSDLKKQQHIQPYAIIELVREAIQAKRRSEKQESAEHRTLQLLSLDIFDAVVQRLREFGEDVTELETLEAVETDTIRSCLNLFLSLTDGRSTNQESTTQHEQRLRRMVEMVQGLQTRLLETEQETQALSQKLASARIQIQQERWEKEREERPTQRTHERCGLVRHSAGQEHACAPVQLEVMPEYKLVHKHWCPMVHDQQHPQSVPASECDETDTKSVIDLTEMLRL